MLLTRCSLSISHLASVSFVRDGIALGVYLSQGVVNGVIDLQFENVDVGICLYHHVGTTKYTLHLGIRKFALAS